MERHARNDISQLTTRIPVNNNDINKVSYIRIFQFLFFKKYNKKQNQTPH